MRYNTSLINLTRKPRYVATFWSPEEEPNVFISSFNFKKHKKTESIYDIYEALDENEVDREADRYGLGSVSVNAEVSVKGLLKQAQS